MNNPTIPTTKQPKPKTDKQPTALVQTESDSSDSLVQAEAEYKMWQEYYQCCGRY